MDGTLIDNVPLHQALWREFTTQRQLHLSEEALAYAIGRKAAEVVEHFWPEATPEELLRLTSERGELYRARLSGSDLVKAVAGVGEFLSWLDGMGVPCVLATDAPLANVEVIFRKFGFAQFFEKVITSDQILHGKPHPEIFLAAAKSVGAMPTRCLVAEDSLNGVAAAKAAKCACLGVATTQSQAELLQEGADFVAINYLNLPATVAACSATSELS